MKWTKHEAQINRKPANMSRSVRLDIKKYCNEQIKKTMRNKKLSERVKAIMIQALTESKAKLIKNSK